MNRMICLVIVLLLALTVLPGAASAENAKPENHDGYQLRYTMLKELYDQYGQFAVSPMSLSIALSMAIEGAAGETRTELEEALGLGKQLISQESYDQLKFANAAIVSDKITLLDAYENALKEKFAAELMLMDENLLEQVNEWVKEKTEGMIPVFLTEPPDPMLRLLLLNALTLDAKWRTPFDPDSSRTGTFHAPTGDVEAEFMSTSRSLEYAEGFDAQAVRLPYDAEDNDPDPIEMILILPNEGELETALERIAENQLDWLGEWRRASEVQLSMPKLSIESELDLKPILETAGVELAFGMDADFSGMTGDKYLYIESVLQKVRIDVDEEGTKAAAATGLFLAGKALVLDSIKVTVDRPFILLIQTRKTNATMFAAVITDPSQG